MHVKSFLCILLLPTLFCSVSSLNTAEAGTKGNMLKAVGKASRSYRKTPTDQEGALTEEMIEKCILLKREIDTSGAEAKTIAEKLDSLKKEVEELKDYLEKNKETVDRAKTEAVVAYNEKITLYKAKADEYEAQRKEYNGKVDPYQQKASQFNEECKGQAYYEDDYQKVVEKLGYGM